MTTSSSVCTSTRAESVEGLSVEPVPFGLPVSSRAGGWGHAVRGLTRLDNVTLGVVECCGLTRPGQIAATRSNAATEEAHA